MRGQHDMLGARAAGRCPAAGRRRCGSSTARLSVASVAVQPRRSAKPGIGRDGVGRRGDVGEAVARSGEQPLGRGRVEAGGQEGRASSRIAGSAGYMPGMAASRRESRPGLLACAGGLSRITPTAPRSASSARALGPGMRLQRAGQAAGPAADHHRDLAAQIEAGEIVMARLGQMKAVADEDQRRVDRSGGGPPAMRKKMSPGIAAARGAARDQRRARAPRREAPLLEPHRLEEAAVLAGRLEPIFGEARARHRSDGAAMAFAAGGAAFHVVGGERRRRRPPGMARSIGDGKRDARGGAGGSDASGSKQEDRRMRAS